MFTEKKNKCRQNFALKYKPYLKDPTDKRSLSIEETDNRKRHSGFLRTSALGALLWRGTCSMEKSDAFQKRRI